MRARFIGDPRRGGEGPSLLPFMGVTFIKGDWSEDLPDPVAKKVSGNSHFETSDEPASEEATVIVDGAEAKPDPLDHDGDGKKGGANEPSESILALRAELDAMEVSYDGRWGEARLRKVRDAAWAGAAAPETADDE